MKGLLQAIRSKRLAVVFFLGFSSGLPLALTGSLLQAWMSQLHVDLTVIGAFSLVGVPYTFKFLWSPLLDRFAMPFLDRRRGWMLVTQLLLVLAIGALAFTQPLTTPMGAALIALCIAFLSASQDIVIDAYRVDVLPSVEFGMGAALNISGYRLGMLVSGSLALILADRMDVSPSFLGAASLEDARFRAVYLVMAAVMSLGALVTLWSPALDQKAAAPRSLKEAVVQPFLEFFRRKGAWEVLGFILFYKLDVVLATALTTPFMLQLDFTKTDIGVVNKGFGLASTLAGTFAGGALMMRIGLKRSLWSFGLAQGISTLTFLILATQGHSYPWMVAAIAFENFFSGMGGAAYSAFIMSLCHPRFTATQFALLTSLMAFSRVVIGAPAGWLAKTLGWEGYFLLATLAMIPGLLLLTRFGRWNLLGAAKKV